MIRFLVQGPQLPEFCHPKHYRSQIIFSPEETIQFIRMDESVIHCFGQSYSIFVRQKGTKPKPFKSVVLLWTNSHTAFLSDKRAQNIQECSLVFSYFSIFLWLTHYPPYLSIFLWLTHYPPLPQHLSVTHTLTLPSSPLPQHLSVTHTLTLPPTSASFCDSHTNPSPYLSIFLWLTH